LEGLVNAPNKLAKALELKADDEDKGSKGGGSQPDLIARN
jgi:hypothetical protein